nr:hypothetical protein REQ54_04758 [Rhizobium sp. Q54]
MPGAVTNNHFNIIIAEISHALLCEFAKDLMAFDGIDRIRNLTENRRRVAGTGADLEHTVVRTHFRCFDHCSDDIGLGKGLPLLYRQWRILISEFCHAFRNEMTSRHCSHRLQHMLLRPVAPYGTHSPLYRCFC